MSRSSPFRSNTAGSPTTEPEPDAGGEPARSPSGGRERSRSPRRSFGIRLAAFARWLHIYLSMFGLAAVLFFSVTGLTLNHPDWFFATAEHVDEAEGQIDLDWLGGDGDGDGTAPDSTEDGGVDRLRVVEYLRAEHDVRGALAEFSADDYECFVTFKGPGYAADAMIDRETGRYFLTQTSHGVVAVLNDLHKGRDTGPAWSLIIDVSAAVLTVISLSGLILLFYLKLRRAPGLAVALVGMVVVVVVAMLWVP